MINNVYIIDYYGFHKVSLNKWVLDTKSPEQSKQCFIVLFMWWQEASLFIQYMEAPLFQIFASSFVIGNLLSVLNILGFTFSFYHWNVRLSGCIGWHMQSNIKNFNRYVIDILLGYTCKAFQLIRIMNHLWSKILKTERHLCVLLCFY